MTNKDVFVISMKVSTVIASIFVTFFIIVWNPVAVHLGGPAIRDGYTIEAGWWEVIWSYIFPFPYAYAGALFLTAFVIGFDLTATKFVNFFLDEE